jgi:hypothetical protein
VGLLKIAPRRKLYTWNAGGRNRYRNEPARESGGKDFVDFRGELKIEIADALNAVGIEIDDHLVPDVEPLRMMIHRFGNQSDLGHPAKSGDEVVARKRFVQFAVGEGPAVRGLEMNLDFGVGEFLRFHGSPPVAAGRKVGGTIMRGARGSGKVSASTLFHPSTEPRRRANQPQA